MIEMDIELEIYGIGIECFDFFLFLEHHSVDQEHLIHYEIEQKTHNFLSSLPSKKILKIHLRLKNTNISRNVFQNMKNPIQYLHQGNITTIVLLHQQNTFGVQKDQSLKSNLDTEDPGKIRLKPQSRRLFHAQKQPPKQQTDGSKLLAKLMELKCPARTLEEIILLTEEPTPVFDIAEIHREFLNLAFRKKALKIPEDVQNYIAMKKMRAESKKEKAEIIRTKWEEEQNALRAAESKAKNEGSNRRQYKRNLGRKGRDSKDEDSDSEDSLSISDDSFFLDEDEEFENQSDQGIQASLQQDIESHFQGGANHRDQCRQPDRKYTGTGTSLENISIFDTQLLWIKFHQGTENSTPSLRSVDILAMVYFLGSRKQVNCYDAVQLASFHRILQKDIKLCSRKRRESPWKEMLSRVLLLSTPTLCFSDILQVCAFLKIDFLGNQGKRPDAHDSEEAEKF